ncbi:MULTISPECIES: PP2C family protein-serine/threonine phosphatase [unclassified Streptomyces]|uniref:PP2C family protein-serine/threonine phosphatase n=1 Tax=unclassified Streptomyces TaxID=2593676 RepID=UPI0004C1DD85|nr:MULTISPECIES: fused response regulator/phosphatase [unclassified Streptomyces]
MTPLPPGVRDTGDLRILLVEDDAGDALLVEELLFDTDLGHTLVQCRTIAEARAELTARPADCVLLDLHLPDVSGLETIDAVRDTGTQAAVIVLTGLAESHAGVEALAAGAQDYLVKGKVDPELLQRAVRYAVQRKQSELAGVALHEGRLRAQENARLERGLLPLPLLTSSRVTTTTRYFPGREQALLGGDFLDVVQTEDGLVHAVVGDVSGHGPDAAALGVCLRIAWRALTLGGHRGHGLLHLLEQIHLAERAHHDLFTTCTLITADLTAGTATIHLAGHHEPLLLDRDGPQVVKAAHGLALGILPGTEHWPATTVALPPTGALLVYTDGLIEGYADGGTGEDGAAPGSGGGAGGAERLGTEGLLRILARTAADDPGTHLDRLISTVRRLNADRHTDDIAVLRLDWSTPGQTG